LHAIEEGPPFICISNYIHSFNPSCLRWTHVLPLTSDAYVILNRKTLLFANGFPSFVISCPITQYFILCHLLFTFCTCDFLVRDNKISFSKGSLLWNSSPLLHLIFILSSSCWFSIFVHRMGKF
jgi:hypothetical protein